MSLDIDTVRKVARLARIGMNDEELTLYQEKLNTIMGFVEQLGEVDTDHVAPLPSPVDITLRLRDDEVSDGNYASDVLANAPEQAESFYVVPKVVE